VCAARRAVAAAAAGLALVLPMPAAADVLVVGDSLGVGTAPHLRSQLEGVEVEADSRIGRPTPEGVRVLAGRIAPRHHVVAFDLGTNNDPRFPQILADDLAAARRIAGDRCMVVATINRPPVGGATPARQNEVIAAFAAGADPVEVVDWQGAVDGDPSLLASDGVHATPEGYAARGGMFADAVRRCLEGEPREAEPEDSGGTASRPRRRRREPDVPVPGIEASGVVFSEPVEWRGAGRAELSGDLILPAGEGPHAAVALLPDEDCGLHRDAAEAFTAAGLAALVYDEGACRRDRSFLDQAEDARGAVAALAARGDIRAVGLWASGEAAAAAPIVAAGNTSVDAVVVVAPVVLPPVRGDEWKVRTALAESGAGSATAAVSTAWRLAAHDDDRSFDPAPHWRGVAQPVLALWTPGDEELPARAGAEALLAALEGGRNEDRTFATQTPPAQIETASRWLGRRLGRRPPQPAKRAPLPPAAAVEPAAVDEAGPLATVPVQAGWLGLPLLLLLAAGVATRRAGARGRLPSPPAAATPPPALGRLGIAAVGLDLLALAAIAGAVASIVAVDGRDVPAFAGMPAAIAAAFALTAFAAAATVALAVRRPRTPLQLAALAAGVIWLALALYWLL